MKEVGVKRTSAVLAVLLAVAQAPASRAQTPDLPYGPPLSLEQALRVASVAEAEAKARHVAVTVAIVDSGGTLILEHRMDGATLVSVQTAPAKATSAVMWKRPTSSWATPLSSSPAPLSLPHVIVSAGGELLLMDGRIVGAIGVGGSLPNEGEIAKKAAAVLDAASGSRAADRETK
jgi:uncharacterized protein GlcG (DUF336 family)